MGITPAERWRQIAIAPDNQVNLAEAALVIAAGEYQGLDIGAYLDRIDDMAARLRRRLRQDITPTETLIALNHYLFEELGFTGNGAEYY
ncbi:MAG: transglutaminase-like domain-containing protein, partial [Burkholderiales bacterium]|nr:transglutaminase-like domain-containing protein [Burkholderiales bacterium]